MEESYTVDETRFGIMWGKINTTKEQRTVGELLCSLGKRVDFDNLRLENKGQSRYKHTQYKYKNVQSLHYRIFTRMDP